MRDQSGSLLDVPGTWQKPRPVKVKIKGLSSFPRNTSVRNRADQVAWGTKSKLKLFFQNRSLIHI